jgi:ankyrin repeat protein
LHYATKNGLIDTVKLLLSKGAKVWESYSVSVLPLHLAAAEGHLEIAQLFLEAGAPVDAKACFGMTPLMLAAYKGRLKVIHLLLAAGANPNLQGTLPDELHGMTAVMHAARKGFFGSVQLLATASDLRLVATNGRSAAAFAYLNGFEKTGNYLHQLLAMQVHTSIEETLGSAVLEGHADGDADGKKGEAAKDEYPAALPHTPPPPVNPAAEKPDEWVLLPTYVEQI